MDPDRIREAAAAGLDVLSEALAKHTELARKEYGFDYAGDEVPYILNEFVLVKPWAVQKVPVRSYAAYDCIKDDKTLARMEYCESFFSEGEVEGISDYHDRGGSSLYTISASGMHKLQLLLCDYLKDSLIVIAGIQLVEGQEKELGSVGARIPDPQFGDANPDQLSMAIRNVVEAARELIPDIKDSINRANFTRAYDQLIEALPYSFVNWKYYGEDRGWQKCINKDLGFNAEERACFTKLIDFVRRVRLISGAIDPGKYYRHVGDYAGETCFDLIENVCG